MNLAWLKLILAALWLVPGIAFLVLEWTSGTVIALPLAGRQVPLAWPFIVLGLFNLLRCAMETIDTDVGFLGIRLTVSHSERVSDEQIALLEHEDFAGEIELSHLIERLCVRMGQETVAKAQAIESHVPERAWMTAGSGFRVSGSGKNLRRNPEPGTRNPSSCLRPLHLFNTPEEILVMVTPSHDVDGKPFSFSRPNFGGDLANQVTTPASRINQTFSDSVTTVIVAITR